MVSKNNNVTVQVGKLHGSADVFGNVSAGISMVTKETKIDDNTHVEENFGRIENFGENNITNYSVGTRVTGYKSELNSHGHDVMGVEVGNAELSM